MSELPEVGPWAEDKHARIKAYLALAAKTVGVQFIGPGKGGFFYIDPYCGPPRARIRDTGQIIEGSALVAATAARSAGAPFTCLHIADKNPDYVEACATELRSRGETVLTYSGEALATSAAIASRLSPRGLHFAFLDPFNLNALPFDVIHNLASLQRIDILVHFSSMDLQRNFDDFLADDNSPLDAFAPGWRTAVHPHMPPHEQRRLVREHWQSLMATIDLPTAGGIEHIQGSRNQTLYWLIFAAKHNLARKFWDAIQRAASQQRSLF